jgi:nucleoside-diphosphate-sugar epimerase
MSTTSSQVIVTGVAGFVGSHLAERLVAEGYSVVGVDCFTDYYARAIKEANLTGLLGSPQFQFIEADILHLDWAPLLGQTAYLFHQAAQAGVRGSWGDSFGVYVRNNVLATQYLLEAAKQAPALKGFIFASSSSVYGDAETFPTPEDITPRPVSPYGVTKLACEHLCRVYHQSFDVPVVTLRYFTAYGPRQRPDMAFHKFISAMLRGDGVTVYGDGEQTRDFTYVSDIVEANILAMQQRHAGQVFNIGGGSRISVNAVIDLLEEIVGKPARRSYVARQKGDATHTSADVTRAHELLGYQSRVSIGEGLRRQVGWTSRITESQD